MGQFFKANTKPVEPVMKIYEDACKEPGAAIDAHGQLWLYGFCDRCPDDGERQIIRIPKVLFADVPVMIHTKFGFSLAPMRDASPGTGSD
jgi:hypothetical protein